MLALCLMLLASYNAQNYASIIGRSLSAGQHLGTIALYSVDFLQRDIDNLFHWTVSSNLYFSFSKFAHLQFWAKSNLSFTYKINSKPITEVETIKDLGIIISHDLTWERHYKMTISCLVQYAEVFQAMKQS